MTTVSIERIQTPGLTGTIIHEEDWETLVGCLLCGNQDVIDLMEVDGGAMLSACVPCRYGFLRRRPTADWFSRFYASEWDEAGRVKQGAVKPYPRVFNAVKDVLPDKSRVLDVGAGFGDMLLPFKQAGHEVWAIEPSEHRATMLRENGINVTDWLLGAENFDLIITHHSMEHMHNPVNEMQNMARVLKDGGYLYIAVPSIFLEHAIQAAHFVPHLSLFSFESLVKLIKQLGLSLAGGNHNLDLEILASKTSPLDVELGFPNTDKFVQTCHKWATADLTPSEQTHVWSIYSDGQSRYPRQIGKGHIDIDEPRLRAVWTNTERLNGLPVRFEHTMPSNAVWVK